MGRRLLEVGQMCFSNEMLNARCQVYDERGKQTPSFKAN